VSARPKRWPWITALALWIAVLIAIQVFQLDLALVRSVYRLEGDPFPVGDRPFWRAVDKFGTYPGNILGFGAGLAFLASFKIGAWAQWRRAALFVALCTALGPGLLVNGVLKKTWDRPRPRNVVEFSPSRQPDPVRGPYEYREWWQPGPLVGNASFPSGHVAIACSTASLLFIMRRRRRWWATVAGVGLYTGVVASDRILDGAHFLSDVLWSVVLTLGVCFLLARTRWFGTESWRANVSSTPAPKGY
jgi:membrane-associated phospholipid phosphatase